MTLRIVRGTRDAAVVAAGDRGLNYGDGLFETVLVHRGLPVWWNTHRQRLVRGAKSLDIPLPDDETLDRAVLTLAASADRAVLKVVLTRGVGGRGYAPPADPSPTAVLSLHELAVAPATIAVRWCELRLGLQPRLAGHKHLNRLEHVLARAEWDDAEVFEGLLCDSDGRVVCATAANVFVRRRDRWLTPRVDRCGVAGVMRAWCLHELAADEVDLVPADVETADAVFLCNAVRGILPVHRLGSRLWSADAPTDALRRRLAAVEPAFATE